MTLPEYIQLFLDWSVFFFFGGLLILILTTLYIAWKEIQE